MIFPYCCALPDFNEPFYENENGREMKKKRSAAKKKEIEIDLHGICKRILAGSMTIVD